MRHPFDLKFGVETSGLICGRDLVTGHAHDRHNTAYFGVSPSILHALCAHWQSAPLSAALDQYSFIDLGCGMGRAILLAAEMPFREVVGVELNATLAATAQKNIQAWESAGRVRCSTRVVCGDATEFQFPENPCVVFLFNPFGGTVLRRLIKKIERAFAQRPGQLDLLYVNHECESLLTQHRGFIQLWSGAIYKSSEDEEADRKILYNQPDGEYIASEYESCSAYRWTGVARPGRNKPLAENGQPRV
ncbi:MAG TPA: class I SAM-dependent methyltransferase [Acidisarcina sp.]|nr:class I SAM-dependent methyltransferase [Acidisarcina sp.]